MADYDVAVIGAGPGGYVAAIRAGQLGMRAVVIERENVGGVCLNWGCIPSKALLRNAEVLELVKNADEFGIDYSGLTFDYSKAIDRSRTIVDRLTSGVSFLLKKNGVHHIVGTAKLLDEKTISIDGESNQVLSADKIIIATGARPRDIPNMMTDGETVLTYRDAIVLRDVPRRIVIVGGGPIGVEFAQVYHSYGAQVTIVELLPSLVPLEDAEISQQLEQAFTKRGIEFLTNASVNDISVNEGTASVNISGKDGNDTVIECDKVLVAVGIQPNSDGIGLEEVGVDLQRGFVSVDEHMETNIPGVFAIGDVTGKMPLAHVASAQGVTAVEYMGGMDTMPLDYGLMPKATYCKPQVASFGLTELQAKEQGFSVKIGRFPMPASGKALALGEAEGMIKLVVDDEAGEIIGAHMIGPEVTELLGEVSLSRLLEGTTTELGWLVHPHPTISEALKEAALAVDGQAIHI